MPQVFKAGSYWVYFWANENDPLEPIHVHVSKGKPGADATKIWITSNKKCIIANNRSKIPDVVLGRIVRLIEARCDEVIDKWEGFFGEVHYYF